MILDRDLNAARNLAALAELVAGSGSETENARSLSRIRPGPAGRWLDREAGTTTSVGQTGTALRQRRAA